ncbi:uncharacterized protein L969DRAFT_96273 [Mixia osmundae IAM 14324]|uniref:SET domain-containing protein n=1 Tax=Mixia osmundae (strain CBS 9802 / IAM 14324 / JCM 22182 / KY 12970) TaxID=764103 RepID=G7E4Y4_MIXOS|nr:uncharacterized protein L969DRAFT_96273 [Mixia osmundae IAM 14324]KEI37755.1 hypothetical protein L969DRAFT_96273 [Mixia osmundae IAM 14324]GAA97894.1 hypothetical protein E5Q_04574 [Mixia osmundae IAM 14324]
MVEPLHIAGYPTDMSPAYGTTQHAQKSDRHCGSSGSSKGQKSAAKSSMAKLETANGLGLHDAQNLKQNAVNDFNRASEAQLRHDVAQGGGPFVKQPVNGTGASYTSASSEVHRVDQVRDVSEAAYQSSSPDLSTGETLVPDEAANGSSSQNSLSHERPSSAMRASKHQQSMTPMSDMTPIDDLKTSVIYDEHIDTANNGVAPLATQQQVSEVDAAAGIVNGSFVFVERHGVEPPLDTPEQRALAEEAAAAYIAATDDVLSDLLVDRYHFKSRQSTRKLTIGYKRSSVSDVEVASIVDELSEGVIDVDAATTRCMELSPLLQSYPFSTMDYPSVCRTFREQVKAYLEAWTSQSQFVIGMTDRYAKALALQRGESIDPPRLIPHADHARFAAEATARKGKGKVKLTNGHLASSQGSASAAFAARGSGPSDPSSQFIRAGPALPYMPVPAPIPISGPQRQITLAEFSEPTSPEPADDAHFSLDNHRHIHPEPLETGVFATQDLAAGTLVFALQGKLSAIKESESNARDGTVDSLPQHVKNFSILFDPKTKKNSLFTGPSRFVNHDCNSNALLCRLPNGVVGYRLRRAVAYGEEITGSYGHEYFGPNNEDCLCQDCEIGEKGAYRKLSAEAKAQLKVCREVIRLSKPPPEPGMTGRRAAYHTFAQHTVPEDWIKPGERTKERAREAEERSARVAEEEREMRKRMAATKREAALQEQERKELSRMTQKSKGKGKQLGDAFAKGKHAMFAVVKKHKRPKRKSASRIPVASASVQATQIPPKPLQPVIGKPSTFESVQGDDFEAAMAEYYSRTNKRPASPTVVPSLRDDEQNSKKPRLSSEDMSKRKRHGTRGKEGMWGKSWTFVKEVDGEEVEARLRRIRIETQQTRWGRSSRSKVDLSTLTPDYLSL